MRSAAFRPVLVELAETRFTSLDQITRRLGVQILLSLQKPFTGVLSCVHHTKDQVFRFRQTEQHNVRKSLDWPVSNTKFACGATFGIGRHLHDGPQIMDDKVGPSSG